MPDPDEFHETDEQVEGRADQARCGEESAMPSALTRWAVEIARSELRQWASRDRPQRHGETERRLQRVAGLAGVTFDELLYEVGVVLEGEAKVARDLRDGSLDFG